MIYTRPVDLHGPARPVSNPSLKVLDVSTQYNTDTLMFAYKEMCYVYYQELFEGMHESDL